MIDLTRPDLPSALLVDGRAYEVDTSFRTWVRFEAMLREGVTWPGVFAGEVPQGDWLEAALEFLRSENATPKRPDAPKRRAVDCMLDGDYIVASFQQAYGIDLTACDMHWHRFRALLTGLPAETIMSRIIGFRTYETPPQNRSQDAYDMDMRKRRDQWALPDPQAEAEERAANEWFERWAYQ